MLNNDAISRNALMIALMDRGVDHIQADDLTEINQIVSELPSVTPNCDKCDKWIEQFKNMDASEALIKLLGVYQKENL